MLQTNTADLFSDALMFSSKYEEVRQYSHNLDFSVCIFVDLVDREVSKGFIGEAIHIYIWTKNPQKHLN